MSDGLIATSGLRVPSDPHGICLVGFMGAGKTSIGEALARRLGWTFEDLDNRIQRRECRSIEEIFRTSGEAAFREAEHAALRESLAESDSSPCVLALGGGAFAQEKNRTLLSQARIFSVFLDAPAEELFRRCAGEAKVKERPLRQSPQQFSELYNLRRAAYLEAAMRVDTAGKEIETIAAELASQLAAQLQLESGGSRR
jgi:shikimate kinase